MCHKSFILFQVKGFQLEYLVKVPEVKDTVHKHSLLHHLCHMVMEKFPDSTDLYSEVRAALLKGVKTLHFVGMPSTCIHNFSPQVFYSSLNYSSLNCFNTNIYLNYKRLFAYVKLSLSHKEKDISD